MSESRTYPAGVTSWIDVTVDDVEAAKDFYGRLFGWTFTQATPPGIPVHYVIAQLDGQDVAGIGGPAEPTGSPSRGVEHLRRRRRHRRRHRLGGGRGRSSWSHPVEQAGEGGHNATVADPSGVEISLWQAKRRLGAQVTNTPGAWNFSDLHAADPVASQAFYEQVFGWVFVDIGQEIRPARR